MVTKVKTVESYEDSQGKHIVAKGKLVLLGNLDDTCKCKNPEESHQYACGWVIRGNKIYLNGNEIKPIIISETEKIEVGWKGWAYKKDVEGELFKHFYTTNTWYNDAKVVLVLPEQFTKAHLQAIIDGKMKDGDEVYVECEEKESYSNDNGSSIPSRFSYYQGKSYQVALHLPEPGHVKLFSVKKEESWDDIFELAFYDSNPDNYTGKMQYLVKWLKENYNSPTKKK